jgi:hypothetical protein
MMTQRSTSLCANDTTSKTFWTQFYVEAVTRTAEMTPRVWNLMLVVENRQRVFKICLDQNLFRSFIVNKKFMSSCKKGNSSSRALVHFNNIILMNTSKLHCKSVKKLFVWDGKLSFCTSYKKTNTHRTTNYHIYNTSEIHVCLCRPRVKLSVTSVNSWRLGRHLPTHRIVSTDQDLDGPQLLDRFCVYVRFICVSTVLLCKSTPLIHLALLVQRECCRHLCGGCKFRISSWTPVILTFMLG